MSFMPRAFDITEIDYYMLVYSRPETGKAEYLFEKSFATIQHTFGSEDFKGSENWQFGLNAGL